MMEVERQCGKIDTPGVITTLLSEFSAVADYRTLRDSLPRRLASLLKCRCVLLYQRSGETLQFVSGSFDDKPGWSSSLLAVAHINPINLSSDVPEACAWRERHSIGQPASAPTLAATPLIYRQRGIGVLVAIRSKEGEKANHPGHWVGDEMQALEAVAGVVALLLENTRLLERDRERIHELALLNSISSQMTCSMYDLERVRGVIVQRAREISTADLCAIVEPSMPGDAIAWVAPELRAMLFQRFREYHSLSPVIIERPGQIDDPFIGECLKYLPPTVKTLFVVPLLRGGALSRRGGSLLRGSIGMTYDDTSEPRVLGFIIGAYYQPWKLKRAEVVLLQVLASQASAVLENIHLMTAVLEARNEARKLLRQVLDDRRMKELILASIPSGLITTDQKGDITTFNRAAEAILGYHPYEVLGHPLHKFLDLRALRSISEGSSLPVSSALLDQQRDVLHNMIQTGTVVTMDRHGREIVLDVDVLPLCKEQDGQVGTLATFTDVTSVHRLEEEKRRLDHLASLGEMAANVAHEVRNPLASIKTSMQLLKEDLLLSSQAATLEQKEGQAEWAQESISVVLQEVDRLDTLVRDLLLFAKPCHLHRVRCNIAALSDQTLKLIEPQCLESNITVHRIYGDLPPLWADAAQIEQILFNLYINAIQAMPDGGILTISCHSISADSAIREAGGAQTSVDQRGDSCYSLTVKRIQTPPVQQWLEIAVSDTGTGIPPEQLEHIFQPFFTTKAHGIGLGLAITRRLVEDHGGYIRVEGHYGYGAIIAVRLPLLEDMALPQEEQEDVEEREEVQVQGGRL
ncbi:MAG TPA: ATP-binding protein [Ktedonobacteraceae bacterium]|nr:ATP-binding protein [Ktedonobacteraceae bacterium]